MIALALAALVEVAGAAECPSPARVAERLGALLPAHRADPKADRARLDDEADGDGVRLELRDGSGLLVASRRLTAASCDARADDAAILVAAWEAELRPESLPAPSFPSSAPLRMRPRLPIALQLVAAAILLTDFSGSGGTTAGAIVDGALGGRRWRGFALHLRATATGARTIRVGVGSAEWLRPSLALGARMRFAGGGWALEAQIDPLVAALLSVRGGGYPTVESHLGWDAGVAGGAALSRELRGALRWWVGVQIAGWWRRQQLIAESPRASVDLPRFELAAAVGLALGTEP